MVKNQALLTSLIEYTVSIRNASQKYSELQGTSMERRGRSSTNNLACLPSFSVQIWLCFVWVSLLQGSAVTVMLIAWVCPLQRWHRIHQLANAHVLLQSLKSGATLSGESRHAQDRVKDALERGAGEGNVHSLTAVVWVDRREQWKHKWMFSSQSEQWQSFSVLTG